MMGKKTKQSPLFYYMNIADMIPEDHILRLINKYIDFSFIRKRAKHLYSDTGKPSIDPEVLIKMLFIGYLYGITSESPPPSPLSKFIDNGYSFLIKMRVSFES